MKKRHKKIIIILATIIVFVVFIFVIARSIYFAPTDEITLPIALENKLTKRVTNVEIASLPSVQSFTKRLTIPAIKVDARIQDVGITRKGNMSTPSNFFDVGLFKYGPLPGEIGSAVIDGHVDNGFGFKAVFGNLSEIKKGDDIYVQIDSQTKVHFVVVSTSVYDYTATTGDIFNQVDGSYLKLITCSGTWIPEYHTHDKRLVVTAVKSDL